MWFNCSRPPIQSLKYKTGYGDAKSNELSFSCTASIIALYFSDNMSILSTKFYTIIKKTKT